MQFYCIWDRIKQGHFTVCWHPDIGNLSNYFTNHHMYAHHYRHIRSNYLLDTPSPQQAILTHLRIATRVCWFSPTGLKLLAFANLRTGIVKDPMPDTEAFQPYTMNFLHMLFRHAIQCQPFIFYHHFITAILYGWKITTTLILSDTYLGSK